MEALSIALLTGTVMSDPHLPQETIDDVIDLLHNKPEALKACCLVSKSWVPRTRKHLFAEIEFISVERIESWKRTFPEPSTSPAYHTHTLFVRCTYAAMAQVDSLTQTFPRVVWLKLRFKKSDNPSLAPFHKFSPTLKSLSADFSSLPCVQVFDLVRSFPLLEDLALTGRSLSSGDGDSHGSQTAVPSNSPALTGSLDFHIFGRMGDAMLRLLDLPNGLHFRKVAFAWTREGGLRGIAELVVRCSDTLECLDVWCNLPGMFVSALRWGCSLFSFVANAGPTPIDLSKATKLRDAVFRLASPTITWIIMALQTITSKHRDFQQISIHFPHNYTLIDIPDPGTNIFTGATYRQWSDLDRLLVQFWESRSIRPKVIRSTPSKENSAMGECIEYLLPEITRRGILDLVDD